MEDVKPAKEEVAPLPVVAEKKKRGRPCKITSKFISKSKRLKPDKGESQVRKYVTRALSQKSNTKSKPAKSVATLQKKQNNLKSVLISSKIIAKRMLEMQGKQFCCTLCDSSFDSVVDLFSTN